jgi:hypothetical protein
MLPAIQAAIALISSPAAPSAARSRLRLEHPFYLYRGGILSPDFRLILKNGPALLMRAEAVVELQRLTVFAMRDGR